MPAAIPIVIGAALTTASVAIGASVSIGTLIAVFAGAMVLGGLSYALAPKPGRFSTGGFSTSFDTSSRTVTVRQSDITRSYVYGHTRITTGYAHMEATEGNSTLHAIIILCEGELRAINEIWVNDYAIPNDWIDGSGNITQGRYAGYMKIFKHLGSTTQGADATAVSEMDEWTENHRLQGIAYLYIQMIKNQDIYPTGVPNISAIVEGMEVFDPRESENVWTTNIALLCNDFILNERYGLAALSDDVDATNVAAQANICDEIVDTEDYDSIVADSGVTASNDMIQLEGDVLFLQFGDRVRLIVESGSAPAGLAVDTDYYIIPYQIKDIPRIQLATSLENAMNKVAIDITGSSGGGDSLIIRKTGEPRYHGSGVFDTGTNLTQTLNDLASSMAGRAVCIGGFWSLLAGAWRSPTVTLTDSDVRGSAFNIRNSLSMTESFNQVQGLYISSINYYQATNYPIATYSSFISEDMDMIMTRDLNLPFTNRPTTAQRIAKVELFRGRQDISIVNNYSTKALQLQPGDTVNIDMERYGWEPKIFEVTEFSFDVNDGSLTTRLSLRETAEAIYDWAEGEAITVDAAPNTTLPNPFNVLIPTGVAFDSRATETASGNETLYTIQLQWNAHPDAFVREFGDFELQFKLSAAPAWLPSFFVDGTLTKTDVFTASVGLLYDMRIRARNNLGVRSGWVTLVNATVGSSGGVIFTEDWGSVADAPDSSSEDWGSVADAPDSSSEDWGSVA